MIRALIITGLILGAAISRLIPHPPNFMPITAIALFGGAYFLNRYCAFLVPLAAMLMSDFVIGFHDFRVMVTVYGSFVLITAIGCWLSRRRRVIPIAGATLASSILFFLTTNFAVWATKGGWGYATTPRGLLDCYVAGIPFFGNTLLGDVSYTFILFGGFALIEYTFPRLREAKATA